jgi:hypothetical protein
MIKLIGFTRLIFLACLLALNLAVLGVYFFSIGPMLDDMTAQRDAVNAQISELRGKISGIKEDMTFATDNLPKFNELKDRGFFQNQDRFQISRIMEDLRTRTGITSFSFTVSDVKEVPNTEADAINYKLINSHIKVDNIVSPLDSNIYMLAQQMPHVFPSFGRIQSMDITRAAEVNEATLKDIAEGRPVNFVNAALEFDWLTMVPKPAESTAGPDNAPAGFRRQ